MTVSVTSMPEAATRRSAATWEAARSIARDCAVRPLPAVVRELSASLGHALAEPLTALTDLPSFDTSAMDGWAVAGPGPWRLSGGGVLAGTRPEPLRDGTAVPIATGAPLPTGASAVLRREHGEADEQGGLLFDRSAGSGSGPAPLAPGRDIRPRGQECRAGEPLLPSGTTVTASVLGLAAAAGYDRLTVHRRPAVELLLLGDELLESGLPHSGRVRDALGPLLPPWLRACGARVTERRRVSDDFGLLREAVRD
ncbi:molybdopterin molybdenumtransferase MoeA, partial [Streptomyces sp. NPDC057654]